jgi:hypothetical protein
MYGFKPKSARGKTVPQLADGENVKPRGFKEGGLIRGPGTGTSDSIQTEKRPGTFIMPADSTQAIGPEALEELGEVDDSAVEEQGEKVPVRLSNGEFELPPEQVQALGEAVLTVMRNATHQPVGEHGKAPTGKGFTPHQFFAGGGTVQDEERLKRINQIPAGSDVQAPAPDGQDSTELTRNVNNGLNALGGMGAVASVPLRAGQAAKAASTGSGATALPSGIPRLTGPAQAAAAPAADFVAGMGPGATTYANTIPRIGNAPTPVLPGTNAALQQGAQANVMSAATRTASGANAGATALDSTQRNNPDAAPATAPATTPAAATQCEYGRQMSALGGALVDGAAWLGKTIVSAPGYGFSRPSAAPAPAAAAITNPTDARLAAGTQRAPSGFAPAIKPQAPASASAPVVVQRMAQPPQSPAFDFDNFQPAPGQGAFRNEQTGEVTRLQDGPTPRGFRAWKEPNVVPRADAPQAQRQEVRAPVLNPNGGVFAAMADFTNQAGQAVQAIAANKGMRNDRKDALDQQRVGLDAASTFAKIEQGDRALGIDGRRADTAQDLAALQADELGLKREAAGFQTRAAAQQEQLRNTLIDPKATPEQRKQAQEYLQALAVSGKEPSPQYKSYVMPAIRNADGSTTEGGVYQENTRTGEGRWVKPQWDGQAQQAMPKPASKAEFDALPKGTRFTDPNGQVRIK